MCRAGGVALCAGVPDATTAGWLYDTEFIDGRNTYPATAAPAMHSANSVRLLIFFEMIVRNMLNKRVAVGGGGAAAYLLAP